MPHTIRNCTENLTNIFQQPCLTDYIPFCHILEAKQSLTQLAFWKITWQVSYFRNWH